MDNRIPPLEVSYNTFLNQMQDFITPSITDGLPNLPRRMGARSISNHSAGLYVSLTDGQPPRSVVRSASGSVRSQLSRMKARANLDKEHLEKQHELLKAQMDIHFQMRLNESEKQLKELDIVQAEYDDCEDSDNLSDCLDRLTNVPDLEQKTPDQQTMDWATHHFLSRPGLSVSDRVPGPTTQRRAEMAIPPDVKPVFMEETQRSVPYADNSFVHQLPRGTSTSTHPHQPTMETRECQTVTVQPPDNEASIRKFNFPPSAHRMDPQTPSWMPDVALKMSSISNTMEVITSSLRLPSIEIPVFSGEEGTFLNFVAIFEQQIEQRELDGPRRLQYLIQFTREHPQELVKGCVALPAHAGYQTAKALLVERYGEPFETSMYYVRRLTKPDRISANDRKALRAFSDELKICTNALTGTGFIHEINSSDNLRRIVRRLPDWAIKKWNSYVDNLRRHRLRPGINHICDFVSDQARICNDPVFGGLVDEDKEIRRKPGKPGRGPFGPEGSKTGFAGSGMGSGNCGDLNNFNPPPPGSGSPPPPLDPIKCVKCSESHSLFKCPKFKALSVPERIVFVRAHGLCFLCFRKGHFSRDCIRTDLCMIDGCKEKHARFLHSKVPTNDGISAATSTDDQGTPPSDDSSAQEITGMATALASPPLVKGAGRRLLPILPVRLTSLESGRTLLCNALLDSGSDTTFILGSALTALHAPTRVESITLNTLGGTVRRNVNVAHLSVADVNGNNTLPLRNVYSQPSITIRRSNQDTANVIASWSHLHDLSTEYLECSDVKLIIGTDTPDALVPLEVRTGRKGSPFAVRTRLGWTVLGHVTDVVNANAVICDEPDQRLEEQLSQYFRAEFSDVYDPSTGLSVSDKAALRKMEESIVLVNGHFQMRLPWKDGCPKFPNNYSMAVRRLELLKRRLSQNQVILQKYTETVEGYLADGYAEKVSPEKLRRLTASSRFWLLVHFAVSHPLKPSKTRVVFDCPAKFRNTSLNDQLHQGPDNNNSMLGVILRFRQGLVAASGDIEAMFHQVRVHDEDCDSLCFLWWPGGDLTLKPEVHRMLVFVFGAICSPSAAVFALQQCAKDNPDYDQSTLQTILRDFYVDDCLTSTDDELSMICRVRQVRELLQKFGFRLTKWVSTSSEVLQSIPEADRAASKPISVSGQSTDCSTISRALGLWWNVDEDVFVFECNLEDKPASRRNVLSLICKTFDPTGCISPFVLPAKIVLQDLCRLRLDWDDPIPDEHAEMFRVWKADLPLIEKISLPRCYKTEGLVTEQRLHHFSDASMAGYGCCSYLRTSYQDGTCTIRFLLGKSRVCPLKSITIPRLELAAAALAARMESTICKELTISLAPSVFWTDSVSTLGYIRNREKRYHTFVANRVAKIHESSSPSQWHFVCSEQNPADLASRGITASNQDQVDMWLNGPTFLSRPEDEWPTRNVNLPSHVSLVSDDPEERQCHTTTATADHSSSPTDSTLESKLRPLFEHHSTWTRLKRAVAALQRVRSSLLQRARSSLLQRVQSSLRAPGTVDVSAPFTAHDLIQAQTCIIQQVQYEHFSREIDTLRKHHEDQTLESSFLKRSSHIKQLNPELDDNGLLRVGGRLRHSMLRFDTKHPCILPSDHPVTALIIRHVHETSGHSGREYVLSLVRQRFWILRGNATVRRILSRCFDCRQRNAPNLSQKMADLPEDRVTPDKPPFTSVGIDYFGPFYVRCRRSQVKRYGCIFTCLASRATHLEIAHSLDTNSFLNAFQRFVARRGRPSLVRSDNGTNFQSGAKELKSAIKAWNQQKITNILAQQEIRWVFNPPASSSWGGVWERGIRSLRRILSGLAQEQTLTDEALQTLFCQVEEIMNGRPLTPVSADPRDLTALTPNDLLLCRPTSSLPPGVFSPDDNYARRRWRQVQYLTDVFWRRWTKEYLVTLQRRTKWNHPSPNITINDLVVVQNDQTPRNCWPLGRVLEVIKGKDGLVRAARVKCARNVLVRPCTKLCLVEKNTSL